MNEEQRDRVEGLEPYVATDEIKNVESEIDELGIDIDVFDDHQLYEIVHGLTVLTPEAVSIYADSDFSSAQMFLIRDGLLDHAVSLDEVKSYADVRFDTSQMSAILDGFQDDGVSNDKIAVIINPEYDSSRMREGLAGLLEGMTTQEVDTLLSDSELTTGDIESIRESVYDGADLNEAIDIVKTASEVVEDIANGNVEIDSVSRWDVDCSVSDPIHDYVNMYDFHDVYYTVETDKGNFEIRIALWDQNGEPTPDNIDRIIIRADTDSLDGGSDSWPGGSLEVFRGDHWSDTGSGYGNACALLDAVHDHGVDDGDIHEIFIYKGEDEYSGYNFEYSIDGQTVFVSDDFSGSMDRGDSIAKFCEEHKDATTVTAVNECKQAGDVYGVSYDEFKANVQDAEAISELPDGYEEKHFEAMVYIVDANHIDPSGSKSVEEYMAKIDRIEACGVLDKINETVESLKSELEENGEASYTCDFVGYNREVTVSGNDEEGWKIVDGNDECDCDSEEEALERAWSAIEYDYSCDVGIPGDPDDEDAVDKESEGLVETEEEQIDPYEDDDWDDVG